MRLVEFVGPPCAGKTTVAARLLAGARGAPGRAPDGWSDAHLLARRARFRGAAALHSRLPRRPVGASTLDALLLRGPDEADLEAALQARGEAWRGLLERIPRAGRETDPVLGALTTRWTIDAVLLRASIEAARSAARQDRVAVLDEGVTHPYKLAAICDPEDPEDVATLMPWVPMPDVLVRFDLAPDVLAARMLDRRRERPDGPRARSWSSAAEVSADVRRTTLLVAAVVDEATRRGTPVLTVDAAAPVARIAADVIAGVADVQRQNTGGAA